MQLYPHEIVLPSRVARFEAKIRKTDTCWLWTAGTNNYGYGVFTIRKNEFVQAHRFAYMLYMGPLKNEEKVLHKCDNPPCCNPAHLWKGTQGENMLDAERKGHRGRNSLGQFTGKNQQMPIINPDTSNMLDMSSIPAGTYPGEIAKAEFETAKSSGNPMIVVTTNVEVDGKSRPRKSYLVIAGEGAYGLDQLLRAVGFSELADQYKNPSVQPKPDFDTDQLIGQRVNVIIEPDTYNGQLRDRIKGFLPA